MKELPKYHQDYLSEAFGFTSWPIIAILRAVLHLFGKKNKIDVGCGMHEKGEIIYIQLFCTFMIVDLGETLRNLNIWVKSSPCVHMK